MKRLLALLAALLLCPCTIAAAQETAGSEWAEKTALAFLQNPSIDEPLEDRSLTVMPLENGEGWLARAEAAGNRPWLEVRFSNEGTVWQYQKGALRLPDWPAGENVRELTGEQITAIDNMNGQLFCRYNQQSVIAVDSVDGREVCFLEEEMYGAYLAVSLEPSLKVYAYGDLSKPTVQYGDYLSLQQAQSIALALLQEELDLNDERSAALQFQEESCFLPTSRWLNQEINTPCWYVVYRLEGTEAEWAGGLAGDYGVLLDALTGEKRLILSPWETGNG